jgi:hypothetical protein
MFEQINLREKVDRARLGGRKRGPKTKAGVPASSSNADALFARP